MDKTSAVTVSSGEFVIRNIVTIGEETQIAVRRSRVSNGMYGQMIESPNQGEATAAWDLFRMCELDGRIEKAPDGWKGCEALSADEFNELWKGWTEQSGLFRREDPPAVDETGAGDGKGQS